MTLRSVSTRNRPIWRLPPFGALTAASTIRWMSSIGIGSGLNRRTERWVNIASPIGIFSRSNAIRSLLPACELCGQPRQIERRRVAAREAVLGIVDGGERRRGLRARRRRQHVDGVEHIGHLAAQPGPQALRLHVLGGGDEPPRQQPLTQDLAEALGMHS